jgi:CubicO group peptidase (beta-lactamase class C family)
VIQAADGVLDAGAPGVAVEYRDARKPGLYWSVRRGEGDLADEAPVPLDASFRIGSVTKTYLATAVLGAVGEEQLSLDDTLGRQLDPQGRRSGVLRVSVSCPPGAGRSRPAPPPWDG